MKNIKDTAFNVSEQFINNRKFIVDWLLQIKNEICLLDETFFQSIGIFDKTLINLGLELSGDKLLHIGLVSLWIASKFCETTTISVNVLQKLSGDKIHITEIVKLERKILQVIKFKLPEINFVDFMYMNFKNFPNFNILYSLCKTTYIFSLYDFILTNYSNSKKLFTTILKFSIEIYKEKYHEDHNLLLDLLKNQNRNLEQEILLKRINFIQFFDTARNDMKNNKMNSYLNFVNFEINSLRFSLN